VVKLVRSLQRSGRNDYQVVVGRVTDDAHLEPRPVDDTGIGPLVIADRYAAGRPRNN
jgi:hypothetical protein